MSGRRQDSLPFEFVLFGGLTLAAGVAIAALALRKKEPGSGGTAIAPAAPWAELDVEAAARMLSAGVLVEQGKTAEAAKAFAAIAADGDAPQAYRDLASIREVSLTFDQIGPAKVVKRLKPLAVPGNPWFGSAGEMVAMAYVKQGNNELAGALFAQIAKDKTVPDSLRRRTRQMAGLLGVDAVEEPGAATLVSPAQ